MMGKMTMQNTTVLIVEDEALLAADLKRQLGKLGYETAAIAPSSIKAMKAAEELSPDLVLMDIQIKGKRDGIETAQMIRDQYGIPIIFLTAYADDTFLARAKLTEPFGYLLKPVETRELHSTIEMALYKSMMQKEREDLIQKLEKALEEVKILRGFLPICSFCKKIRDDKGDWQHFEKYIKDRSEAEFTHSICPVCAEKEYSEFVISNKLKE